MDLPVCIDGRLLDDGGAGTGVGQYARALFLALQSADIPPLVLADGGVDARRSKYAKRLAAVRPWTRAATPGVGGYHARDIFREAQVFFSLYKRPLSVRLPGRPGIMHWSYPLPLHVRGWRNIYTVHDVMPLDPAVPTPVNGRRLLDMLNSLSASGGEFLTVSQAARIQILAAMGWPQDKVMLCHQGIDIAHGRPELLPTGLRPDGYLLYVGAVEARKNLVSLLDAYRASGVTTPLVISGPDGLDAANIDDRIRVTPGAMRLGLQPRDTVLSLISGARALILVSLAEGFGVPVAEAMALGTPVLSADVPALAEVGGGATLLVNPHDIAALRNGLIAIDGDTMLRDRLVIQGLQRARYFALEAYAQRLLKLYGMA
jgi:glycosyltransferase involved in cell wall biosynthesis